MATTRRLNLQMEKKKFPIVNFLIEFLAYIELIEKKKKIREEHIEDVPAELEKYLSNFQITIQKKIRQYKNTLGF